MQALTITATMPHGVVSSRPWGVALDGLLSSVLWHRRKREARESNDYLIFQPDQVPEDLDLPLARCGDAETPDWHWMATFADRLPRFDEEIIDLRLQTAHTNRSRLQQLVPVIGTYAVSDRRGRYQRKYIPVLARPCSELTWNAVGDAELIRDLLQDLPAIGKHRGTGEGVVSQWTVTDAPDTPWWSAGHEHEPGILGRTAPLRCLQDVAELRTGPAGEAPIRPPYLHPASRTPSRHPAR
ncbi:MULTISPECIES: hypothetical protein [unclassified Mycobacteroides]|uniref:hypothetical protein n=1 Tax=unclassified Mycobacteroides TaxID=2618759 RepID=UPI000713FF9A|nr:MULTISPECIES: hypothetical protein [unclassified Mycobacteroides]KRQ23285.1 hypothetical protein AOT91_22995 [Mycobacteroides sp. H092]KRQ23454.1 hypothetical protein AOT87_12255 [Mycobacteroides sp. H003]KRQ40263.1 hypothetical protein AOT92_14885 [Mycobacteroides sp. H101]KRQ47424.1 hypothetical protein AOT88_16035 [Mycobacteroides sp. H063]KRQ57711.1 hypothetical protein AOT90_25645 [Mycobacteroides sp. H079]